MNVVSEERYESWLLREITKPRGTPILKYVANIINGQSSSEGLFPELYEPQIGPEGESLTAYLRRSVRKKGDLFASEDGDVPRYVLVYQALLPWLREQLVDPVAELKEARDRLDDLLASDKNAEEMEKAQQEIEVVIQRLHLRHQLSERCDDIERIRTIISMMEKIGPSWLLFHRLSLTEKVVGVGRHFYLRSLTVQPHVSLPVFEREGKTSLEEEVASHAGLLLRNLETIGTLVYYREITRKEPLFIETWQQEWPKYEALIFEGSGSNFEPETRMYVPLSPAPTTAVGVASSGAVGKKTTSLEEVMTPLALETVAVIFSSPFSVSANLIKLVTFFLDSSSPKSERISQATWRQLPKLPRESGELSALRERIPNGEGIARRRSYYWRRLLIDLGAISVS